ncbi:light-harvesting complex I chlorophyll a/b binding protein 1 [Fistulifera solaris]|uniref:Light-harvesting complex I chlorophyll a/b binding protein 1 n=1 Tax=Fistulifera solaris TaxID=1519565 RepID=A0A1Z5K6E8_FISSO|nr:light-harvesting complex I chlorophyll a/b binding protein 1 [Fistulifera solaris]|eukprot:GAX21830.1 light-harvesting complex I chlorophyll a/b binding protein 1 [Fistulifera solaris]
MKLAVLASILGVSAAFAPASQGAMSKATALQAEKSPAMPFLPYPENCKGYIGEETGFDPLGFSNYFPMDYLREAELKHCRIAMLAIVGFITTDVGVVLHPLGKGLSSVAAHDVLVDQKVMGNALIWIVLAEIVSYIGVSEMLQGSGRAPGDFNFGTKYLEGKTEAQINKLKYQELKNGRLAMMAFSGAVTQAVLYDKGFPYF